MIIAALAFYVFAAIAIASAVMVISARNPVHSVLYLILTFFSAAGLFVLLGAEFLAMLLVIVYVGAVMVLFLFVVMMLDVNFVELRRGVLQYLPIGALVGIILCVELAFIGAAWHFGELSPQLRAAPVAVASTVTNTHALGRIIYTQYAYLFQAAGLVLLVAMIGAISLTLRQREGVRRQAIARQVSRTREASVEVVKVPAGKGI